MAREPIPSWYFVVVVVRKGDRFLLVHERKHGQKWYLPAGRIEPREEFLAAAHRETLEETGIPIEVEGIFKMQHTPMFDGTARFRFFLTARPADETLPKSIPDDESLGADWFTLEEMMKLPLRAIEVFELCSSVANGAAVYPVELVTSESPLYFGTIPKRT